MSGLHAINIHRLFPGPPGAQPGLHGVSLSVPTGSITALLGPSGCGKSTLLHVIAGLQKADSGQVLWDDQPLDAVPPHRRGFGLMFQDFALFPHLNIAANVAFGLQMAKQPPHQQRQRVSEMLRLVGLAGFEQRDIHALSGGESQRVALARALAPGPRFLMLDEPLGALDRNLRETLLVELKRILRDVQQTALYVTHDQEEAFTLADQVVILRSGLVEQAAPPQVIYRQPANAFVARFIGLPNILSGQADGPVLQTAIGPLPLPQPYHGPLTVLLRPEQVRPDDSGPLAVTGQLIQVAFQGSSWRIQLQVHDARLQFNFPALVALPAEGASFTVSFDPQQAVQVLPPESTAMP